MLREFIACFIRPEKIPASQKKLQTVDVSNKENHLPQKEMFVGNSSFVKNAITNKDKHSSVKSVLEQLSVAYVDCAQTLQRKMPINNIFLQAVSSIDPCARGHSITLSYMKKLPVVVKNVFQDSEIALFEKEAHKYMSDPNLPDYKPGDDKISCWWSAVSKEYPLLGRMSTALLTCFHGRKELSTLWEISRIQDPALSPLKLCLQYRL